MKRLCLSAIVCCVVLAVAIFAAAGATKIYYEITAFTYLMASPLDYVKQEADGWLIIEGAPVGANYVRQYDGVEVPGALYVEVNGRISVDGANARLHGPVSLFIDSMDCTGRYRASRVDYFESGSWVLQCPDGSKIQDTFHFVYTGEPTWITEGSGRLLIPRG